MAVLESDLSDGYSRMLDLESNPTIATLLAERARMKKSLEWIALNSSEIIIRSEARSALTPQRPKIGF